MGTGYGPVSLYLCLSITSWCSVKTEKRIELVFGIGASFHLSYTVLRGNSSIYKNIDPFLWNFS